MLPPRMSSPSSVPQSSTEGTTDGDVQGYDGQNSTMETSTSSDFGSDAEALLGLGQFEMGVVEWLVVATFVLVVLGVMFRCCVLCEKAHRHQKRTKREKKLIRELSMVSRKKIMEIFPALSLKSCSVLSGKMKLYEPGVNALLHRSDYCS